MTQSKPKHDLDSLLNSLPSGMVPTKDLWPTIKPQLTTPVITTSTAKWPLWAIAASLVVCSTLLLILSNQVNKPHPLQATAETTKTTIDTDNNLKQLIEQIAQTHQAQLAGFSRNKYTVSWQLSVDNGEQIQPDISKALTELDSASAQVQAALTLQPTNQQLWQLWRWIMQRQINLLQQGQKLPFTQTRPSQGNII